VSAANPDPERALICRVRREWSEAETVQFRSLLNRAFAFARTFQKH
jgi:hypothetical protein